MSGVRLAIKIELEVKEPIRLLYKFEIRCDRVQYDEHYQEGGLYKSHSYQARYACMTCDDETPTFQLPTEFIPEEIIQYIWDHIRDEHAIQIL